MYDAHHVKCELALCNSYELLVVIWDLHGFPSISIQVSYYKSMGYKLGI